MWSEPFDFTTVYDEALQETQSNWECSWEDSERFQLHYFKALPFVEKCKAVENMCATAKYFERKALARRNRAAPKPDAPSGE